MSRVASLRTQLRDRTPVALHPVLRRLDMHPTLNRARRRPRWGNLRRDQPISRRAGRDRGTPIDRYYVEQFVVAHAHLISGHVLETTGANYASRLGHLVDHVDVVDVDDHNPAVTILAELGHVGSLHAATYDCAIITHQVHAIPDTHAVLVNLWASLKPGGHLLLAVPSLTAIDAARHENDARRFLAPGLRHDVEQACRPRPSDLVLQSYGNLRSAVATLMGLAAEELSTHELDATHPDFPVLVALVATKPDATSTA